MRLRTPILPQKRPSKKKHPICKNSALHMEIQTLLFGLRDVVSWLRCPQWNP